MHLGMGVDPNYIYIPNADPNASAGLAPAMTSFVSAHWTSSASQTNFHRCDCGFHPMHDSLDRFGIHSIKWDPILEWLSFMGSIGW